MDQPALSDRQIQTLHCLAEGMGNAAIAEALDISENTVKSHVKSIFKKLRVRNRTTAVVKAAQLELIPMLGMAASVRAT